jgi:hypothetical protein
MEGIMQRPEFNDICNQYAHLILALGNTNSAEEIVALVILAAEREQGKHLWLLGQGDEKHS